MSLKAVIVDVDGTLADTEEAHRQAFNDTFRQFELPWRWDASLYRQLLAVTGGRERIRHYCVEYFPAFLEMPDAEGIIDFLHAQKTRRYAQIVTRGLAPRPGVVRLLRQLRDEGVRLAIATTTSRANVGTLLGTCLGALGADAFEAIGAGEDAAAKKPAPDIYRRVLEQLALPPEDCLAIEDSPNGLLAAHAAGLPVLVTECPWTAGEDFSEAVAVLSDLGEPDRPHRVIRSSLEGIGYVDATSLRRWHVAWRVALMGLAP